MYKYVLQNDSKNQIDGYAFASKNAGISRSQTKTGLRRFHLFFLFETTHFTDWFKHLTGPKTAKLLLVLLVTFIGCLNLQAQTGHVAGVVYDAESKEVLVGATVEAKGLKLYCVTDVDGRFSFLETIPLPVKIVVSYLGMEPQEVDVPAGQADNIAVYLKPTATLLEEVVVQVAYGEQTKKSIVGAVSSIRVADMTQRPLTGATSLLEGTSTGIVVGSSGQPGEDAEIRIRGFSSINGSNTPLYVVDGMIYNGSISDLNVADIEDISVLKDAASAALYGNKAANGVVLVTTKRSRSKELKINVAVKQGLYTRGIAEYDRLGADDFMEAMWLSNRNSLVSTNPQKYSTIEMANADANASIMDVLVYNIYNKPADALFDANGRLVQGASVLAGYNNDLDWYAPVKRTGYRQEYNLGAEGGGDKGDYYVSLGYLNEDGYINYTGFDRLSFRTNLNLYPTRWLKMGLQANGSHQNMEAGAHSSGAYQTNAFYMARMMAPIYPVHLHDSATGDYILSSTGEKQYDDGSMYGRPQLIGTNYVYQQELNIDKTERNILAGQAYATIRFLQDFTFTVKGSLNITHNGRSIYYNGTIGDAKDVGRSYRYNTRQKTSLFQKELRWKRMFGEHSLNLLLAHENYSYEYNYLSGRKDHETFPGKIEWTNFSSIGAMTDYKDVYRTESLLGRVQYDYDSKYFAEFSFRNDGSSRFHPKHRWGHFWSAGAAWILSREKFLREQQWLDFLKLRVSYGEVGNDAGLGYYGYMGLYHITTNGGNVATYKSQNEAPDVRWETTTSFDLGFEATLFNRWNLSIEYYDKRSVDLLFNESLPLSAGATSTSNFGGIMATITKNVGTMSNRGWELQTDVDVIKNRDWTWNLGLNVTLPWNKVVKLPKENREAGIISGNWRFMEDHSMYAWWLTKFVGVDQMTGNALYEIDYDKYYIDTEEAGKSKMPESTLVQIGNNYYTTNASIARKDWCGDALPDCFGSFSSSLRWKNLSLSALLTYSIGGKMYDASYAALMSTGSTPHALHQDILGSWNGIPQGMTESSANRIDPDGIPVIDANLSVYNNATSSRFLVDASYLSLKNVALTWRLPSVWLRSLELNDVALSLSVENALYVTARKGLNPQESFDGSTNNKFVSPRIFSFGINVKL